MLRYDERGVSAIEVGLIMPVLVLGLLGATDLGLAEYTRMALDHALRVGAQTSIRDPGISLVRTVMQDTAAKNFPSSAVTPSSSANLSATRFCACPESPGIAVACSTTCSGSSPTFIFYRLSGTTVYKGMILPALTLNSSVQVQVR